MSKPDLNDALAALQDVLRVIKAENVSAFRYVSMEEYVEAQLEHPDSRAQRAGKAIRRALDVLASHGRNL